MSSSVPDDHLRRQQQQAMIGLPSTYRPTANRRATRDGEYDVYVAQMAATGLPSSTMPSAANSGAERSLEQHPHASSLNSANAHFGVFEPPVGHQARPYSTFAPLLGDQQQQQAQRPTQQVPGEFVPGNGGGIFQHNPSTRPHMPVNTQSMPIHDVSRSNTTMSGYSDPSSSANLSSPVRSAPPTGFHPYASPPDYAHGYGYQTTAHPLEYPSSGSDPFNPSSDPYASPSPGKHYMSSPEPIQHPHQQPQQRSNIFAATNPTTFAPSPTRPGPTPFANGTAWQPVPASSLVPSGGSSGGSNGGGRGPFSGGSSGGPGVGRSNSFGANANRHHPTHGHTQSQDGLLAVPHQPSKRQRRQEEEEESDSEDEVGSRGPVQGAIKRL